MFGRNLAESGGFQPGGIVRMGLIPHNNNNTRLHAEDMPGDSELKSRRCQTIQYTSVIYECLISDAIVDFT
jgi:hypothetical protein